MGMKIDTAKIEVTSKPIRNTTNDVQAIFSLVFKGIFFPVERYFWILRSIRKMKYFKLVMKM